MERWAFSRAPATWIVACAVAAGSAGCSSSPGSGESATPASRPASDQQIDRVKRLAYRQMLALSKRTCAAVPRKVLWSSLAAVSGDPRTASGSDDDNGIALLYAEDVGIQGIPLQRAAYDGCIRGLKSQR